MESANDTERRSRLHELDSVLDALEQLNLRDSTSIPSNLRQSLEELGVSVPRNKPNITDLIERVWELQEHYLQSGTEGPPPVRYIR